MSAKRFELFVVLFLLSACLSAQHNNVFSNFKNNIKRADRLFEDNYYLAAIDLYKKILDKDSNNAYAQWRMANCYRLLNKPLEAEAWYAKIMDSKVVKPNDKLYYAEALVSNGKYEASKKWFDEYSKDNTSDSRALRNKNNLQDFGTLFNDSLSFSVSEVSIDLPGSHFAPLFYKEGIIFLSPNTTKEIIKKTGAGDDTPFLDLYYSEFAKDDSLSIPEKFDKDAKSKFNEGPLTFFDGGRKVIFTRNNGDKTRKDVQRVHLMLFYAEIDSASGEWKNIIPLPFNAPKYSVSHPSFCQRTSTLFFASDMPGGFGETDIYESKFENNKWTTPVNLGKEINTEGKEMFPFVYEDSILLFSSNGHGGLGGLDLFYSFFEKGKFGQVKNAGYPLNSNRDDFGLIVAENGREGYFSSNRKKGNDNIYYFKLNTVSLNGRVVDMLGEKPLNHVVLSLYEEASQKQVKMNNDDGKFFFQLKPGKEYTLKAELNEYKEFKTSISTKNISDRKSIYSNITLEKKNKSYVRCIIKDSLGRLVKNCKLRLLNESAKEQVFYSNEKGEIHCEVYGDADNVFIAEKDGKAAVEKLKIPKQKEGSSVLVVDLRIKFIPTYRMEGILKSEKKHKSLPGYEVHVKNRLTGEHFVLCTDEDGHFSFSAYSYGSYIMEAFYEEKKSTFEVKLDRDKIFEMLCK